MWKSLKPLSSILMTMSFLPQVTISIFLKTPCHFNSLNLAQLKMILLRILPLTSNNHFQTTKSNQIISLQCHWLSETRRYHLASKESSSTKKGEEIWHQTKVSKGQYRRYMTVSLKDWSCKERRSNLRWLRDLIIATKTKRWIWWMELLNSRLGLSWIQELLQGSNQLMKSLKAKKRAGLMVWKLKAWN